MPSGKLLAIRSFFFLHSMSGRKVCTDAGTFGLHELYGGLVCSGRRSPMHDLPGGNGLHDEWKRRVLAVRSGDSCSGVGDDLVPAMWKRNVYARIGGTGVSRVSSRDVHQYNRRDGVLRLPDRHLLRSRIDDLLAVLRRYVCCFDREQELCNVSGRILLPNWSRGVYSMFGREVHRGIWAQYLRRLLSGEIQRRRKYRVSCMS